jgi:ribosomal-protein-alanine N-acetyltransferase
LNGSVAVREATAGDVDDLCAIADAQPNLPRWTREMYRLMLDDANRNVMVAAREGAVIGFVAMGQVMDEAEIELIVVASEWKRTGVGRMLVDAAMQWAKARGVRWIGLEVRAGNDAARAFYTAMGYEVCGRRRDYYAAPMEDAINMRLRLT